MSDSKFYLPRAWMIIQSQADYISLTLEFQVSTSSSYYRSSLANHHRRRNQQPAAALDQPIGLCKLGSRQIDIDIPLWSGANSHTLVRNLGPV
jgi:hypothetical protein